MPETQVRSYSAVVLGQDSQSCYVPPQRTNLQLFVSASRDRFPIIPRSTVKLALHMDEMTLSSTGPALKSHGERHDRSAAGAHVLPYLRDLRVTFGPVFSTTKKGAAALKLVFDLIPLTLTSLMLQGIGTLGLRAAANLVQQVPSLAMLTLDSLRSVKGVIAVLSALPRTGFGHLYVTLYDHDNFELEYDGESQESVHAKLAASFPESVNQFSFYSTLDLPRLPLATHALMVDVETLMMPDPLPFAPTLRRLELYSNHDYNTETELLLRVFMHLPKSLTHLKVRENALPGGPLIILGDHLPPQLDSLTLVYCDLTATNMDDYFTGRLPAMLLKLNIFGNYFKESLPAVPFGIRALPVSVAETLQQTGGEGLVTAWVTSLPSSLRLLDLHWNRLLLDGDQLTTILLEHLNVQVPGRTRRVQLRIVMFKVSAKMLARLRDKFDLVDANMVRVSLHTAALAQNVPPRLESLSLTYCDLAAADMDQHLASRWPSTLPKLNLYGNDFKSGLPAVLIGFRFLSVSVAEALHHTGGVEVMTAWVASLPPTLRVLDLHLDRSSDIGDLLAAILLEHLNIRSPGRAWRVQVRISCKETASAETLALLHDKA